MIAEGSVKRLTAEDVAWDELVPGLDLARSITAAGTTQLGGGYMRFSEEAEFGPWTLKYDEVLFVQSGQLTVVENERSTAAAVGEAILIPKAATVTYRGRKGTVGFFVLWPFDWNKEG
jgi:ethanolamine utilization protein EutQ (cupin superfamily)